MSSFMRLGLKSPNEFIKLLNQKNQLIQSAFLARMTESTRMTSVKAMLGDSTVTEQQTFDPQLVTRYFQRINDSLREWSLQDVSETSNADLRRIFTKFEIREGNYLLSGHMSLQFHVLLYYKPVQRVMEIQKELSGLVDRTRDQQIHLSDSGDKLVLQKLKERGYKDLDHQNLFEIFYKDDELREQVFAEIQTDTKNASFEKLSQRKDALLLELDSLLLETYQTTHVLIDDPKLVSGEEGCLLTLDLEFVKDDVRQGLFDPRKMSDATRKNIIWRLDEVSNNIINQGTGV